MAGDSRIPGRVAAGYDGDGAILGFTYQYIAAILTVPEEQLKKSLALFCSQGRVSLEKDKCGNPIIAICSWEKYQSEYSRQREYRQINNSNKRSKVNGGNFTTAQWMNLVALCGNRCLCCGQEKADLCPDHIVPISKGGRGDIFNIQPLCGVCNRKKGASDKDYRTKEIKQELHNITHNSDTQSYIEKTTKCAIEGEVEVEGEVEEKQKPCRSCGETGIHTCKGPMQKQGRERRKYPKRTDEFPTSRYREPVSVAAAEWDPHGFSAFWQAYPLKVHEDSAREAWNEIKPTAIEEVLAGIARWRRSSRWTKDDGQYIPNPETFLVKKSWRDEPKPDIERSLSPREALQKKNRETIERVRAKRPDSKKA